MTTRTSPTCGCITARACARTRWASCWSRTESSRSCCGSRGRGFRRGRPASPRTTRDPAIRLAAAQRRNPPRHRPVIDATYMSDETTRGFTGTMIGMACVDSSGGSTAHFDTSICRMHGDADGFRSRLSTGRCRPDADLRLPHHEQPPGGGPLQPGGRQRPTVRVTSKAAATSQGQAPLPSSGRRPGSRIPAA